ncbi:MAG: class I SAM-dependent methyltransferase [Oceanibaculum nanhaiense]|uniref:class I SAM-dependent methyltransferase n=1 Tax=Oceanibaculum nanhaiense TaxID=1909734 RepID=UPI0025A3EA59|nr:class I SAM-dependent methyltransferase [Oceanibaculum nanhaiense]MDM7946409.1 class I SAM-dependent methyltransferase [Oceanibaculum nanhaiense]
MSRTTTGMTEDLRAYLIGSSVREPALLTRLREETASLPAGGMQISPEQGQLMRLLVELTGAKRCLEVGTFTGYSALCVAMALPADGTLVCCDVNAEWTGIGRRYWQEAGLDHKIDLRLAPATETLEALIADGEAGSFDFAFIDADKGNYDRYYEAALTLLRPGGLIGVDNVLWGGSVINAAKQDEDTLAIQALNAKIAKDERVTPAMIPIGDGLTLARKR